MGELLGLRKKSLGLCRSTEQVASQPHFSPFRSQKPLGLLKKGPILIKFHFIGRVNFATVSTPCFRLLDGVRIT